MFWCKDFNGMFVLVMNSEAMTELWGLAQMNDSTIMMPSLTILCSLGSQS